MLIRHLHALIAFILTGLGFGTAHASTIDFMPIVSNFSQAVYGGGLQNWSVTQSATGQVYFGNQKGLLSFDGYQWNTYSLPSHTIVRSVLADGERIYVGSYTDFGYFRRDRAGRYQYTSLWPKGYQAHEDEIWKIIKAPNGHIYFQSFCSWFDYDGQKTTAHYDARHLPLHFFKVNNRIYAQMINDGVYVLQGNRYVPFLSRQAFNNDDVVGMVALKHGGILAVTSKSGLYLYQHGKLERWATTLDSDLRQFQLNNATLLSPTALVIGTILNGIYALDLNTGQTLWHYNLANSLRNNTVLGLYVDKGGNVWAALDNGISVIHSGLPLTVMRTDQLGLPIGMVYDICKAGDNLYIATNQSLWQYLTASKELRQVKNTNGQNWYVKALGQRIWVGHNLSTLAVTGDVVAAVPGSNEGSTMMKSYHVNGEEALIESGYNGLNVYRRQNGEWSAAHKVRGFQAPILEFEIDNSGTIWAAHFSKGIYKIDLSDDLTTVADIRYFGAPTKEGIHSQIHVMKIRGRVVFSYQGSLYTYDDLHGKIVPYQVNSPRFPRNVISTAVVDNSSLWTADNASFSLFHYDGGQYHRMACFPYKLFGLDVNTNGVAQYVSGEETYFFLNNGIGRYRMKANKTRAVKYPLTIVSVSSIKSDNEKVELSCAGDDDNVIQSDNIRLVLSYPNYDSQLITFRYKLRKQGKDVEAVQDNPVITFNSLGYGSYTCELEAVSVDGEVLARTSYQFEHVVPWYLSIWAFALYVLVGFLVIRKYVQWHTRKIVERNRHEAEEELMRQNLKVLEQKQIIAAQQQIIMENELTSKSKELATMAFKMAVQKDKSEVLREGLLEKKRKGILTDKDFKELITTAEGEDSEEVWNIFQQNFDLIHQNFFRNLRTKYPDLTATDLKFCALLRLNLNTKEIAKNTNLTIRGVEGARYRLRKKLGIKNDQSLTAFLIDLK